MIATPGAVLFAVPVPKNVYANNTPTPGPGFGSKINRIDFPALAALCMKQVDKLFEGKIKPGFEMIVNNFSLGILGIFLVLAAYYAIGPFVQAINVVLSGGVSWIIAHKLIPFASIFNLLLL